MNVRIPLMKKAFITGITGQDGSYLAEFLLAKGYEVHGLVRRSSSFSTGRINHLYVDPHLESARLFLHYGDLLDASRIASLLHEIQPDEIYNLAAQSHVRVSFDEPIYTGDATGLGAARILEAMRSSAPNARLYQASSSEMFGNSPAPQGIRTSMVPRSPYGAAKLYAHNMVTNYRDAYGLFAVSGILFNHESPRRGPTFVTRKITRGVAAIHKGIEERIYLGNLDAVRDWGYAADYVVAMWRMLQQDLPVDTVIGTGSSATVREFLDWSFASVGLDWENHVEFDPRYLRPTEVDELRADVDMETHRAFSMDSFMSVADLAETMVRADLKLLDKGEIDVPESKLWEIELQ